MMPLWRQNDVAASFWRHNDVIYAPCVRWVAGSNSQQLAPGIIPQNKGNFIYKQIIFYAT